MKVGAVVSGLVATLAMGGAVIAFSTSASPYVTIEQAKRSTGDRLHLAGLIDQKSIRNDVFTRTLRFNLMDESGQSIPVVHRGEMPTNLSEAKNVVAVGGVKDGVFESSQLIVKCPSKYEADKNANGASGQAK